MAGRIPQHFIDELLTRADIVEIVGSRVELKRAGSNHKGLCPFHSEKTASFTVSESKQFYHCFGCGEHGSALSFLMNYEHVDFVDAVEMLAQALGLEVPREDGGDDPGRQERQNLYTLLETCQSFYKDNLKKNPHAIDYLKHRGLDGETARRFGIGYVSDSWDSLLTKIGATKAKPLLAAGMLISRDNNNGYYDRFRDRIMFPIRDSRGRVLGFGGRVLEQGTPKYLNSPESPVFHKRDEVYGLYEARQADSKLKQLIVVEGYMDVVALSQHGINNAVATLGTAVTEQQLQRLYRLVEDLVFCFDGDNAGKQAAWRALENALPLLREGREARFLFLPQGEDPDTMVRSKGKTGFLELLKSAIPAADYMYTKLASDLDSNSIAGKARLAELAKPLLAKVPDGIYKELLSKKFSEHVGVNISKPGTGHLRLKGHAPNGYQRPAYHQELEMTPMRLLIALLLQHPKELLPLVVEHNVLTLERSGMDVFLQLYEIIKNNPELHTAALLERLHDAAFYSVLTKLAQWEPAGSPDSRQIQAMFIDAAQRLQHEAARTRVNQLLELGKQRSLEPAEKNELRALLQAPN